MSSITISPRPRPLGKSGIIVSPIAWGMWRLEGEDTKPVRAMIDAALGAGITLFDTGDIYGYSTPAGFGSAEALFGRAMAEDRSLRDRIVLATKGGITPPVPYDSSEGYLEAAIDASLRRLQTDAIHLWQVHRRDFLTHPHEVARVLTRAITLGKIHAIGVSNYSPAERDALQRFLHQPIVATQPEFSALRVAPLYDGTIDQAMAEDMAVLAWSPLGGGRLATGEHPARPLLTEQGARFGVDATAAALSWVMAHPARIIPIIGTQNPGRIAAAADAYKVAWTRGEWYAVMQAGTGERLP